MAGTGIVEYKTVAYGLEGGGATLVMNRPEGLVGKVVPHEEGSLLYGPVRDGKDDQQPGGA